jgi:SNF2 family DNA or RNA helicase
MSDNPFEPDKSEDELKALVDSFKAAAEEALKGKEELEEIEETLTKEESDLLEQMANLRKKKIAIRDKKQELNKSVRVAQLKLTESSRQLSTFMSEKAVKEKIQTESKFLDIMTASAPWREWAFDHQIDGAKRAAVAHRAVLGDKTGLGKTLTSIIYMDMVKARKVLVVAPKDILRNFQREIVKYAPHRKTTVLQGMPKMQRDMFLDMLQHIEDFVVLINYEAWRKDDELIDNLITLNFDTVICDEAHTMKEGATKAFRGVREIVYAENVSTCAICECELESVPDFVTGIRTTRCSVCFSQPDVGDRCSVKNVMPMSATNIVNKPQDFWPILNLVDRMAFPTLAIFLREYCYQSDGRWYFKAGGEERLLSRLGSKVIARSPESAGVKMPQQITIPHILEWEGNLYSQQREAIAQINKMTLELLTGEDNEMRIEWPIAQLTRLRQAITWPAGIKMKDKDGTVIYQCSVEESIILDKAMDIGLQAIDEGDRVVMFSQFKEVLKEMEQRFIEAGITVVRMDGDASTKLREEIVLDFDSKGAETNLNLLQPKSDDNPDGFKYQVVLCHYRVGGQGINLDLARQTVLIDTPWNPAMRTQAVARTRRLNTTHSSIVHTIHMQGKNVITWMDGIIQYKEEMMEGIENSVNLSEELIKALRDGEI